jgi:hypothetical protein
MTEEGPGHGPKRLRRYREVDQQLPAALDVSGRADELVHGAEVQASGARGDHRHSVPGTMIPGGARPAASAGEWERIQASTRGGSSGSRSQDRD